MITYLTDKEIHVMGIQRTGQHAITSWLIGHFDKVCYINSMSTGTQPKRSWRGIHAPYWYFEPKQRHEWEVSKEMRIRDGQDAIILGTEWMKPELKMNPEIEGHKKLRTQESNVDEFSKSINYVMVLRTPYNHFASILAWHRCVQLKNPLRFLACWKNFANEIMGKTNKLPNPKIVIKYDNWFTSQQYRQDISRDMGLNFSDSRLNIVMKIGIGEKFGSSFDTMEYKSDAQKMKICNRWEKYKDHPSFKTVMQDEEMRSLSKTLFGEFPKGL